MPFKMIDGKLVKVDDDGNPIDSTTNTVPLEQEDNQGTETVNENLQEDVDPREDIFLTEIKKDLGELKQVQSGGFLDGVANFGNNMLGTIYDLPKIPYNASRNFINSSVELLEDIGDTLGEKTNLGGFRYGKDAKNGIVQYVPYDEAIADKDTPTYGLTGITGTIGLDDALKIEAPRWTGFFEPLSPDKYNNSFSPMAEGIVTFIGGYKGLDKITKIPDYTNRLAKAGKTITLGALTDFVAFGEDTGRLTDIIHQYNPDIEDTWLGYLVSKEDDTWWESRMKNAIEGAGLGVSSEAVFSVLRLFKKGNDVTSGKSKKQTYDGINDDIDNLKNLKEDIDNLKKGVNVDNLKSANKEVKENIKKQNTKAEAGKILNTKQAQIKPEQKSAIYEAIDNIPKTLNDQLDKYNKGEIDFDTAIELQDVFVNLRPYIKDGKLSTEGFVALKEAFNQSKKAMKSLNKVVTDDAVKRQAIKKYGNANNIDGLAKLVDDADSLGKNTDDANATILALTSMNRTVAEQMQSAFKKYKAGDKSALEEAEVLAGLMIQLVGNTKKVAQNFGRGVRSFGIEKQKINESGALFEDIQDLMKFSPDFNSNPKSFEIFMEKVASLGDKSAIEKVFDAVVGNKTWDIANEIWYNSVLFSPKTQFANFLGNIQGTAMPPLEKIIGGGAGKLINRAKNVPLSIVHKFKKTLSPDESVKSKKKLTGKEMNDAEYEQIKIQVQEAKDEIVNMMASTKLARQYAFQVLKSGKTIITNQNKLDKFDDASAISSKIKEGDSTIKKVGKTAVNVTGQTINLPSRFMNSVDEFFVQINYRARIETLAHRSARRGGLKEGTEEYTKAVNQYIEDSFDEFGAGINREALEYSNKATYKNEMIGFMEKIAQAMNEYPILKQVFPFLRVTTNLATETIKRVPFVGVATPSRAKSVFGASPNLEKVAEVRGQQILGFLIMSGAYMTFKEGNLSGATGYKGEENFNPLKNYNRLVEKRSEENFTPFSVKIFDTQFELRQLPPAGALLGLVAEFSRVYDDLNQEDREEISAEIMELYMSQMGSNDKIPTEEIVGNRKLPFETKFLNGIQAGIQAKKNVVVTQTFATRFAELGRAIEDNDGFEFKRLIQNHIASYVPNIIQKVSNDEFYRKSNSLLDSIRLKAGFGVDTVSPRIGSLFQELKDSDSDFERFIQRSVNPTTMKKLKKGNVVYEAVKDTEGFLNAVKPNQIINGAEVNLNEFTNSQGNSAFRTWSKTIREDTKISGRTLMQHLEKFINSNKYKNASEQLTINGQVVNKGENKIDLLQKEINRFKDKGTDIFYKNYRDDFEIIDEDGNSKTLYEFTMENEILEDIFKRENKNAIPSSSLKKLEKLQNF